MSKYNGWDNHATWNVALWIGSTPEVIQHLTQWNSWPTTAQDAEDLTRYHFPNGTPDFDSIKDYGSVNWQEILGVYNDLA
jgi:hypothetical protein